MKPTRRCIALITISLLPWLMAGCTTNKVWVVNGGASRGTPVGSGGIRSYANFNEIKENYQIQGMVWTMILPLMKNKPEAREAVVREAASDLGANGVVSLNSLSDPYGNVGQTRAILVKVGAQSSETEPARPRFIVCALPVSLKTAKTNLASRLATPLALELQIHFAQKGYFSYACDTASVDVNRLAAGGEVPTELKEPLGVAPDFVLDCEIEEGGDTRGFNLKTLRMRATLYDLHLKKTVWEGVQSMVGWSLADYLLLTGGREWSASAGFAKSATDGIHEAVEAAVKKLSPVSGFGKLKK